MQRLVVITTLGTALFLGAASPKAAPSMAPPFSSSYTLADLGVVPGVPMPYGGLVFKLGDSSKLLIGGSANASDAKIYAVTVTRGAGGHVTGFSGTASFFADATGQSAGIDGGLSYGPGDVLFYTTFPDNTIAQIKPGGTGPAKVTPLVAVSSSVGSLAFVPTGFPGAGRLKILSWTSSLWYDATVSPDGSGTYDITVSGSGIAMPGDPEGAVFVSAGNPQFLAHSTLVSEWNAGRVSAYELDGNGDPKTASQKTFVQDLAKAEGAVIDPVTGDFLFSTWGAPNTDHVVVVRGFSCIGIVCGSSDAGSGGSSGTGGTGGAAGGTGGSGASAASGGTSGSGGAGGSGTGAQAGTGATAGTSGTGGSSSGATGGASTGGSGGGAATGGTAGAAGSGGDEGGCGCSIPARRWDPGFLALASILLVSTARRRRVRR